MGKRRRRNSGVRIIFLDLSGTMTPDGLEDTDPIDRAKVARLNKITEATSAKIVISSDWVKPYPGVGQDKQFAKVSVELIEHGVRGDIIGYTPQGEKEYMFQRGEQIRRYLDAHPKIASFVVLDDFGFPVGEHREYWLKHDHLEIPEDDPEIAERFIHFDNASVPRSKWGLQDEHIPLAIEILERERS